MREIDVQVVGEIPRKFWVKDRIPVAGELIRDSRGKTYLVAGVVWQIDGGTALIPSIIVQEVQPP